MTLGGRTLLPCVVLVALVASACGGGAAQPPEPSRSPMDSSSASPSEPTGPSSTAAATTVPPPTVTEPTTTAPALAALEIVEWVEYPYANLADASNRDTRVEMLVRNPNDVPVAIDQSNVEVRLVNGAGDVVYANPNPTLSIWEGRWVKAGETFPISVCACFDSSAIAREEWQTVELVALIEEAVGIAYTDDVDMQLGEWFRLSDRHLGGDTLGADFMIENTSDEVLSGFDVRVVARADDGRYVGVAVSGTFSDRSAPAIVPGASASGVVPTMIDYFDGPMTYEVEVIGIVQH